MTAAKQGPDWVLVNPKADWQARDSTGRFVYDDHLWVLGGWYDPQQPNPLDVWKSPDGKKWIRTVETAPWVQSDLPVSLVHDNKMWIMGGRKLPGTEVSNKVWSSTDGAEWTLESEAGWSPRCGAGYVTFKGKMWVMGGCSDFYNHNDQTLFNDVWTSTDGKKWKLETPNAPWSKRTHLQAVVFDNKIWVTGGGHWKPQAIPKNDVWYSEDGVNWKEATPAAAWKPRMWFSLVPYRGHLWVLAGWSMEHGNFGDVWFSKDGREWTELKSNVIWSKRHETAGYVFKDRIWILGGHAEPLTSEVWSLELPANWPDGK